MSARARIFWAFAAIYLVWGSTYLGIRVAVETLPPFLLAGVRFLVAGAVLYLWARWQGEARPGPATWRRGFFLGALFFLFGNGIVVWAERHVPSGRTALLASTSPLWTTVIESARRGWQRPPGRVVLGVALGIAGLALLAVPGRSVGEPRVSALGLIGISFASIAWSIGSVQVHARHLPGSASMATAVKMLGGGAQLLVVGTLLGELQGFRIEAVSWRSVTALAYLIGFGSIIGFSSFTYLLRVTTPAKVATSSYINPVVAVVLGWALADEVVTGRTLVAAAVIVGGVLLIRLGERRAPEPDELEGVPEAASMEDGEYPVGTERSVQP